MSRSWKCNNKACCGGPHRELTKILACFRRCRVGLDIAISLTLIANDVREMQSLYMKTVYIVITQPGGRNARKPSPWKQRNMSPFSGSLHPCILYFRMIYFQKSLETQFLDHILRFSSHHQEVVVVKELGHGRWCISGESDAWKDFLIYIQPRNDDKGHTPKHHSLSITTSSVQRRWATEIGLLCNYRVIYNEWVRGFYQ